MPITSFLDGHRFDPETKRIMGLSHRPVLWRRSGHEHGVEKSGAGPDPHRARAGPIVAVVGGQEEGKAAREDRKRFVGSAVTDAVKAGDHIQAVRLFFEGVYNSDRVGSTACRKQRRQ